MYNTRRPVQSCTRDWVSTNNGEVVIREIDHVRRRLLAGITAGTALAATGLPRIASAVEVVEPPPGVSPAELARDEAFWKKLGGYYDRTEGVLNLEHGYWGKMAHPVQSTYLDALRMVNAQNSFYARKDFAADEAEATRRIARALGVHEDEIVITRNATEACHNLIRQYQGLKPGDAVLLADLDYPEFKTHMHWREQIAVCALSRSRCRREPTRPSFERRISMHSRPTPISS